MGPGDTFHFCYRTLLAALWAEPQATAKRLAASDKYRYRVAEDGAAVVGVATLQGAGHVNQLFVASGYERGGLGRRLWELLRDEGLRAARPS